MNNISIEPYPFGKRFAVSLVDDTDGATLSNIAPVYNCLSSCNIKITKTVWPFNPSSLSENLNNTASDTLENKKYRLYCEKLNSIGFELAMHTASSGDSTREETINAYNYFEDIFGHPPHTNVMHGRNRENIYWGQYCVPHKFISKAISIVEPYEFLGHIVNSKYYWGDICQEKTNYVRLFDTLSANTLKFDPATPFHDPKKEMVNWWFSSSYGAGTRIFEILSTKSINELRTQRGASIIHCYCRHYSIPSSRNNYVIHPRFKALVHTLSALPDGYYVPVSTLLDRLRAIRSLEIYTDNGEITIQNGSSIDLENLALYISNDIKILNKHDKNIEYYRNSFGQINIGLLKKYRAVNFITEKNINHISNPIIDSHPNYLKLFFGHIKRVGWQYCNGRISLNGYQDPPWVTTLQK